MSFNLDRRLALFLTLGFICLACSTQKTRDNTTSASTTQERNVASARNDRGSPGEYDPGPARDSQWPELFSQTPNYRGIGQALLGASGGEKFRWIFGPMWYRGRLQENGVKVFIVGQEGAQDENVTNRAFTGSTGTRTQKFLNHLGIGSSYLFLNTFVYTINGQLEDDPKFKWMEQSPASPVVEFRHSLFDQMAKTNKKSLALIIGVGTGGKASVATWINNNGGKCSPSQNLKNCNTIGVEKKFGLKKKLLVVGVPHPGGASPNNGGTGALKNIISGFTNAARRAAARIQDDSEWLPEDEGMQRGDLEKDFKYGYAPVPHRDFAFGTNWRMGAWATSSNRQGSSSIQIFSDDGIYNPPRNINVYPKLPDVSADPKNPIPEMKKNELAYESAFFDFDYGPCPDAVHTCDLSELLMGQKSGYQWPDFKALGVTAHPSFGYGAIYRGRLQKAQVLVLADQTSQDDLFSGRALSGLAGQNLQSFLNGLGITESYAIIRTLPVDVLDLSEKQQLSIATDSQVEKVRNKILDTVLDFDHTKVIVTLGPVAAQAIRSLKTSLPIFNLDLPNQKQHITQWQSTQEALQQEVSLRADAGARTGEYDGKPTNIPRIDLPVHTRWWMGTSGDRAARPINKQTKKADGNYYQVTAPSWVKKLKPLRYEGPNLVNLFGDHPLENDGSGNDPADPADTE